MSAAESALPSGEQFELRHGRQRATVVEVGGGLRVYETAEGPVLDGYRADQACTGGRGQHLLPWPNRIADGRYEIAGPTVRSMWTTLVLARGSDGWRISAIRNMLPAPAASSK